MHQEAASLNQGWGDSPGGDGEGSELVKPLYPSNKDQKPDQVSGTQKEWFSKRTVGNPFAEV